MKDRLQTAINKEISIGGKLFCWHDYTCIWSPVIRNHIFDWGFKHICVKCGKSKIFKEPQLEPVSLESNL